VWLRIYTHGYFIIHPNHIDEFYSVVKDLYTSKLLYNVAFDGVFSEAERVLSLDSQHKVAALRKQFDKNSDFFEYLLPICDERYIYMPK
jgi:hypothetical protein